MSQLLKEAKDRARDEFHIENPSNMFVAEAFPIQDKIIKGRRHHARNMVAIRRFRYINVFVRYDIRLFLEKKLLNYICVNVSF